MLSDPNAPLFTRELPRNEFDRRLRENRLNDGLIKAAAPELTTPTAENVPPVYAEYLKIKAENPDSMVMFQLGDFFEFFGEDAEIAAKVLDIALTSREIHGQTERVPLCGIPSHRQDEYLEKLIDAGYSVAVAVLPDGERNRSVSLVRQVAKEVAPSEPTPYTPKRGDRYEIQGRFFVVDKVDTDYETVSLRDVTFENGTVFPIFRSESLEFIRMYEPIQPKPQELAPNQHIERNWGWTTSAHRAIPFTVTFL